MDKGDWNQAISSSQQSTSNRTEEHGSRVSSHQSGHNGGTCVSRELRRRPLDAQNRGSTAGGMKRDKMDTKAMLETLSFGMDRVFNKSSDTTLTEDEIDRIIDRTRTDSEMELKSLSNAKQTASTFDESFPTSL